MPIPMDYSITAGYVYGLEAVTDYCGVFAGASVGLTSNISGGAIAPNGVYAEIIGGQNFVPSIGVSVTNYTTNQTNWVYGRANISILPNRYPPLPSDSQVLI